MPHLLCMQVFKPKEFNLLAKLLRMYIEEFELNIS